MHYIHCSSNHAIPVHTAPTILLHLVDRGVARVISTLGSEAGCVAEVINPPKQDFQRAISNARRVSRQLMSCKMCCVERQSTLVRPLPLDTCTRKSAAVVLGVVRSIQRSARVLAQTLVAVPRHVLDSEKRPVGGKQEIEIARPNQRVVRELDDTRKSSINGGARRCIRAPFGAVAKDVHISALLPVRANLCVERFLDVCTVEVDFGPRWLVVASVDYAELAVGMRACFGYVVYVEARVDLENGSVEIVKLITAVVVCIGGAREDGEGFLGRRELDGLAVNPRQWDQNVRPYLEICVQV